MKKTLVSCLLLALLFAQFHQSATAEEAQAAREIARSSGVATVVVAEQAIDNSYEPRIIPLPAAKQ